MESSPHHQTVITKYGCDHLIYLTFNFSNFHYLTVAQDGATHQMCDSKPVHY